VNQPLSPDEKWLIKRELIAREQAKERKRDFRRRVFDIGMVSAFLASALTLLFGGFFIPLIPKLGWLVCILIYLDADCLLPSFSKDTSLSWHANPWGESLSRLSDTGDIIRGIALLASYKLSYVTYLLVLYTMK